MCDLFIILVVRIYLRVLERMNIEELNVSRYNGTRVSVSVRFFCFYYGFRLFFFFTYFYNCY